MSTVNNELSSHGVMIEDIVPKTRASTILTLDLLENISRSVSKFRPSKSLENLVDANHHLINAEEPITEIDVVISGGGLKAYFMSGACFVLTRELKKKNIRIARAAGASAGSWASLFMLCNVDYYYWIETYHACKEAKGRPILESYEDIWSWVQYILPPDAYKICTGRLFVSITILTLSGPKNIIVSEFKSNQEIVEACLASSSIPYLTQNYAFRKYKGHFVCDGGVTNNCPVFPDGVRRQLVFRLFDVEYPFRLLVNPHGNRSFSLYFYCFHDYIFIYCIDTCIDALILRGGILMSRFLQGEPIESIAWLEKKETKKDLHVRPNYALRMMSVPFAVGGI